MRKIIKTIFVCAVFVSMFISDSVHAATLAEVTAKIGSLNAQEKHQFLVKGAQKEGELVYYGTLLVNEFTTLGKAFNARYPFLNLIH